MLECKLKVNSVVLGQYFDQCRLPKSFEKTVAETHCLFKQQQEPGQFSL